MNPVFTEQGGGGGRGEGGGTSVTCCSDYNHVKLHYTKVGCGKEPTSANNSSPSREVKVSYK